jgi:hypothetical protein
MEIVRVTVDEFQDDPEGFHERVRIAGTAVLTTPSGEEYELSWTAHSGDTESPKGLVVSWKAFSGDPEFHLVKMREAGGKSSIVSDLGMFVVRPLRKEATDQTSRDQPDAATRLSSLARFYRHWGPWGG